MLDKLAQVEQRFEEINEKLCQPDVVSDMELYKKYMQEIKHLTPVVEKFREHKKALADIEGAQEMLDDSSLDAELREMAAEELEAAKEQAEITQQELKVLLLPRDPNDDKNVIVEIRGGAGGDEASLFANSLYRMYSMYAQTMGWGSEILSANETEVGGFKEI
ncbi:MAG: PCRF domain-containing protein, partial [Acutalibacteraceae bacterium]|nr:PCRF domain-containing protein [Acutalibacteraceae bacterium]